MATTWGLLNDVWIYIRTASYEGSERYIKCIQITITYTEVLLLLKLLLGTKNLVVLNNCDVVIQNN